MIGPMDYRWVAISRQAGVKTGHAFHCYHAFLEAGAAFDPDVFAEFAGLQRSHIDRICESLKASGFLEKGMSKRARSDNNPKGTRLPNDFVAPPEWIDWACQKRRWSPQEAKEVAEEFCRYWQARSGKEATKLDWYKTWQNRVCAHHKPDGNYSANAAPNNEVLAKAYREQIQLYKRTGRDSEIPAIERKLAELEGNVVPFERKMA